MGLFTNLYKEGPGVSKDEPEKKGLALFGFIFKNNYINLLLLNWLFIICCIPIITIGPSIKSLSKVTMNLVRRQPMMFFQEFFHEFRQSFFKAALVGLSYILIIFLCIFSTYYYYANAVDQSIIYILAAFNFILLNIILASMMFTFKSLAALDISARNAIKNSFKLILLSLRQLLMVFLLVCLPVYLFILIGPALMFIGISYYIIIAFSINSLIASYFSWQTISKYVVTKDADSS